MNEQNERNLYQSQVEKDQMPVGHVPGNQVQGNQVYVSEAYVNQYFQPEPSKKKEESMLRKNMRQQFSFFAPISAVYAVFYAFCLYRNASGITYPFFVAGTFCYFFCSMKRLGVPYKKDSLFYLISIVLLGISNCTTTSLEILRLNKLAAFLLFFILILHTVYNDSGWDFTYYLGAIFRTIGNTITAVFTPFSDMGSFFAAKKQEKEDKSSMILYIIIGFSIAIPILAGIIALLCSADIVFNSVVKNMLSFDLSTVCSIGLLILTVFFVSYALLSALCKKSVIEEVTDKRVLEPVIAIVITGMLSLVYLCFSIIQILYLFIGRMQLPEGYTYSAYARQGFFQLLFVCIINLILVLICLKIFRENMILKGILTIISFCTFIMIFSSTLRMFMYIARYNLTFLRIFVLLSLMVIFLLMAGVTIYIYLRKFPLFFYCIAITTVFYLGFSFSHPDYWIAKYNLNPMHSAYLDDYDIRDSFYYLSSLSSDAAGIILNEKYNPYLEEFTQIKEIREKSDNPQDIGYSDNTAWIYRYYHHICINVDDMKIRSFNFSLSQADKKAKAL